MTDSKYTKILVPVDGSDNSLRAASVATALAKDSGVQLIALNVIPLPNVWGFGPPPQGLDEYYAREDRESKSMLENIVAKATGLGVKASGQSIKPVTSVVSSIIEFAEENKVDLIIIGTRGLGGFKKLLIGSVSSGVVAHAHCDVLVVR